MKREYRGEMIFDWKPEHYGQVVATGLIAGNQSENKMIGKLVQVRLEAGDFGSDIVLLRNPDNELIRHENQSFWIVPDKYHDEIKEIFKDVADDADDITAEYTLGKEYPETGFIIPSAVQDGESTPMRDITGKLHNKINDILSDKGES